MFETWGIEEVLFSTWIIGSVITGVVVTWGEKDNDAFYVKFMLCGFVWPLLFIYGLFLVSRKWK